MHKTSSSRFRSLIIPSVAGIAVSVIVIGGGAAYFLRGRGAAVQRQDLAGQKAAVAALADAVNRSDAEAVLKYVDVEAVFGKLMRHVLEVEGKRQVTEAEAKAYIAKTATLLPLAKQALVQGVTTQADKEKATGGSLLSALVHLSEGKIEQRDGGTFAVVFADGSSVEFARQESGWRVVGYVGMDLKYAEYKAAAGDAILKSRQDAVRKLQENKDGMK